MVETPPSPTSTVFTIPPSNVPAANDSEYFFVEKALIQAGGANLGFRYQMSSPPRHKRTASA
jgi:hypothetical protein